MLIGGRYAHGAHRGLGSCSRHMALNRPRSVTVSSLTGAHFVAIEGREEPMHATFRDYPKYFELIDGRRYAKGSPQRTHALLQGWLLLKLRELACDRGEVGSEWKFYLGGA